MRIVLAAAVALSSLPALAQISPVSKVAVAPEAATAQGSKPKLICRTQPVLGSRIESNRECHTAEEWTAMNNANREEMRRSQIEKRSGASGN